MYRTRKAGWFFCAFVKTEDQKHILGGLSGILRCLLEHFFSKSGHSFARGILVPDELGGRFLLSARVGCMVQDEKGHKCAFNTKGAAGFKPCMLCKNVVSGPVASFVSDGYTQHVALAEPHTFDLMSTAEFFSIVDLLEQSAGTMCKTAFGRLETASGVKFDPHAIGCSLQLRQHISPVSHVLYDWMHTIVASGGFGAYELNSLVCSILNNSAITADSLDEFAQRIHWVNSSFNPLPKNFFQTRIVHTPASSVRAFAQEVITAIDVMACFAELFLVPSGKFLEHVKCLDLLQKIFHILQMGDQVP